MRMKFLHPLIFILFPYLLVAQLGAGDIAITSFNADSNDEFSFLLLADVNNGQVIYFTENGWDDDIDGGGSNPTWGNTSESTLIWTANSNIPAGTQVQIFTPRATVSASLGTVSISGGSGWSLSGTGDSIIVYTGSGIPNNGSEVNSFLWAFNSGTAGWVSNANTGTTSGVPTGLTDGVTAIDFDATTDNFQYNCSVTTGVDAIRTALATESNFIIGSNSENYQAPNCAYSVASNTAPTNITLSNNTINESSTGSNISIGTLSTNDADSGDNHTYSLVSGAGSTNNGSFNISGPLLRINSTLAPGTYSIRINTNDGTDDFSKQFTITVIDNVDPVISVCASTPANQNSNSSCQGVAPDLRGDITASDSSGTPTITQSPAPGATLGLGTTTITFTATDGSGNTATCSVNLTVVDNTDPIITVCASTPSSITSDSSGQATVPNLTGSVTATDNCTGSPLITQNPSAGATIGIGNTTITLTATDGSGNTDTCSVIQTVTDGVAPIITSVAVPANGTYSAGQALTFTVNFNEDVDVDLVGGTPSLSLTIGTTVVQAAYVSGSGGSSLTFTYNVQSGLSDADGIAVGTLRLNSGSLADASGNAADLTLNNVGSTANVLVVVPTNGLQVAAADTEYVIDFDNTVAGINNGSYTGSGLASFPAAGQLNSNGIVVLGMSNGNTTIGGTFSTASTDFTRGANSGDVNTGGLYAFDVSNGATVDRAFGVQPGGSDFTPGSVAVRLQNRTGAAITQLSVAYEVLTFETTPRNNSFNFGHGSDFNTPTAVTDLKFNAPTETFPTTKWRRNQFQTNITVNIAAGASYYLVWSGDDILGSATGSRPQVALDDIKVVANPSTVVNTIAGEYESITIDGSATVMAGTTVEGSVNVPGGTLTSNGNLTFKSSATRSAILKEVTGGGSITGDVTVEQFYPANRAFRFITSPVNMTSSIYDNWQEGGSSAPGLGTHITGGTLAQGYDQSNSNNPSLFAYNALGAAGPVGWLAISSDNSSDLDVLNLPVGLPLRMLIRGDRRVSLTAPNAAPTTTTLRSTGTLAVGDFSPASYITTFDTGTSGTFAFIGNPYQAQVDLSQTLNMTNSEDIITTRYYAWQPITENYVTYDFASGGVQNGVTNLIQPGQSFFIQTDEASGITAGYTPQITFRENQKSNATFTTTTYSQPEASYEIKLFDQTLRGGAISNDFVRGFINTGANNAIDNQDALKVRGLREQLFVMSNGQELSIERRDHFVDQERINLNLTSMQTGTYTFEFNFNGLVNTSIQLVDQFLGTSTPINQGTIESYSFDIDQSNPASMDQNRFYIEFTTGTLSSGDLAFAKAVQLYPNPTDGDEVNISGLGNGTVNLKVVGLLGQVVYNEILKVRSNNVKIKDLAALQSGVYLVSISQNGNSTTKKLIVE
ncbi:MAG: HYR domain-containing protein [Nonlabens sp.]